MLNEPAEGTRQPQAGIVDLNDDELARGAVISAAPRLIEGKVRGRAIVDVNR
ncbi:hypothetical protein [Bordetella genomosp. 10]|uniref:hypothetical protein n=1 Tax=Bordetella genomosp. 10 TaxID=1416804 RepID=UPI0015C649B7|nr:hypothetical protein [Bordetella genomosp. 10]